MRRSLSILLLLILSLGSAFPAGAQTFASGLVSGWTGKVDQSRLPACCRRNGKHHCAMDSIGLLGSKDPADSFGITTVGAKESCPFMPHALVSAATPLVALAHPVPSLTRLESSLCILPQSTAPTRMTDRRGWPKRGPPATQIL